VAWGFFTSDGKSKSLGHGCWKFYDSDGVLQADVAGDGQTLVELDELASASDDDILYIVDDPGGTPTSKKITKANLLAGIEATTRWEPLANGIAASPALVFNLGDVIMIEVAI
jgi:hypothetical protein